jgi:hypothetical protein
MDSEASAPRRVDVVAHATAALAGAGVWLWVSALTGRLEAWDAPLDWQAGYPALGLACAAIGFARAQATHRIGFTAAASRIVVMVLRQQGVGALMPLGVLFACALGLPLGMLAVAGRWLAGREWRRPRAR